MPRPTSDSPLGRTVHGYSIDGLIGSGGMGSVYRATGPGSGRYALKFMHRLTANATLTQRFTRESKVAFRASSPHLVPVIETGESEWGPFIVMPLLAGKDVQRWLEQIGPLRPEPAVRIVIQACRGLSSLHAANVVHRDIKPSNLFLAREDGGRLVVKICDYGIAKELAEGEPSALTKTGSELGSPYYISPEQAKDSKRVDPRSDVWSLGVAMFRMLTGRLPHDKSGGMGAYLRALVESEPPSVREFARWISPELAHVVSGALRQAPEHRYASVAAFADALEPLSGGSDEVHESILTVFRQDERVARTESTAVSVAREDEPTQSETPRSTRSVGRTLAGRYAIVRKLGRGGMGTVYEVTTPEGTRAAAKLIEMRRTGEDTQALERFLREVQATLTIDSPHVAKTYDVDFDEEVESPLILMELLDGVDLGALYATRKAIEPLAVARVFAQAARGIAAAHALGIVHRDIKPSNLFLHRAPDGRAVVKVCDFGISRKSSDAAPGSLTETSGMLGSPMYMSPEQAVNAKRVDARSDVWSLCASAYEALSGTKLWSGRGSLGEIIVAICTESPRPLSDVAPWVDPALGNIIDRGLAREVRDRWPSMEALAQALTRYGGDPGALRFDQLSSAHIEKPAESDKAIEPSAVRKKQASIEADELDIRVVDGVHCIATWRNLMVSAWRDGATPSRIEPFRGIAQELLALYPEGIVIALRLLGPLPIPEGGARDMLIDLMRRHDKQLQCWAIVIEGEGFRAAAARTAAATLRLVARASFPLKITATPADAAIWIAPCVPSATTADVEHVLDRVAQSIQTPPNASSSAPSLSGSK